MPDDPPSPPPQPSVDYSTLIHHLNSHTPASPSQPQRFPVSPDHGQLQSIVRALQLTQTPSALTPSPTMTTKPPDYHSLAKYKSQKILDC
jgi:hypothetical protein